MKKKFINESHIEGYLYDHKLEKKLTGANSKTPGTEYIAGEIMIATDEKMENVVKIHYTYETAVFAKSGGANSRFPILSKIIDENPTVLNVGQDKAMKLRCDSALELNEWFPQITDEKPTSVTRNEGGFIHIVTTLNEDEKQRNTFKTDMVITNVKDVEADPDKNIEAHVKVKGAIFQDFRKQVMPVEFVVRGAGGMKYFQSLEASPKDPIFTTVWGRQLSRTVVVKTVTESAFGEDEVRERQNTTREFVITGCSKEPYEFDDESTLTKAELSKMMADREIYLADLKQRRVDYENSKGGSSAAAVTASKGDTYDF
jgi:hypothetical protein